LLRVEQLERGLEGDLAQDLSVPAPEPVEEENPGPRAVPETPATAAEPVVGVDTLWPAVLERVREGEGGEMLAALLADARPAALEEDELVLEYPQSASFSKRKIADPANAERLAEALKLVAGRPVTVRVELRDRPADDEVHAARVDEDEVVGRFKDAFDAEEEAPEPDPEPAPEEAR